MIVKLKDLTLDNDIIVKVIKFGYYQADENVEKATAIFDDKIAGYCYNLENKKPIEDKVDPKNARRSKANPLYKGVTSNAPLANVLKKDYGTDPNFEKYVDLFQTQKEKKEDAQEAKSGNSKMLHIQKVKFDDATKKKIINDAANNKPLTKDAVLKSHAVLDEFEDVNAKLVTRVNYAKGFSFWKGLGMTFAVIDGLLSGKFFTKILGGLASKLQGMADTWGELSGTKSKSNF